MQFLFLRKQEILLLHSRFIETFCGAHGLRDEGSLESSLAAPENRAHYETVSLPICAATYAYHITQAHVFLDGNKRIAAAATELFVVLNGSQVGATNEQLIELFLKIAAGELTRFDIEQQFSVWIDQ